MKYFSAAVVLAAILLAPASVRAQSFVFGGVGGGHEVESDSFLGDWQGRWVGKGKVFEDNPRLVAQIVPRGGQRYQINVLPEFDQRCPAYLSLNAEAVDGAIRFEEEGWAAEITSEQFAGTGTVKGRVGSFRLEKVVRPSPTLGAAAPDGAIVLFDGSGFDAWEPTFRGKPGEINWTVVEKAMWIRPDRDARRHSLRTKRQFADVQVHVEFYLPLIPENQGQSRANSGVYVGGYELQILDSYGLPGYYNECGSLYKRAAPMVNMCAPPLQWQTFDVTFHAPKYADDGQKVSNARFTVLHNGVLIHKDREVGRRQPPDAESQVEERPFQPAAMSLQNHGNAVRYRNIWVVPLDGDSQ